MSTLFIDPITRIIRVPEDSKIAGVEHDKDVHTLSFEMPTMYEGFDLSTFDIFVNFINAHKEYGSVPCVNKNKSGDTLTFDWVIDSESCLRRGTLQFIVCMRKLVGGEIRFEFNTTIAKLKVLDGIELDSFIEETYPSKLEEILARLEVVEQTGGGQGGGSGSVVVVTPTLTAGTKIADISVNGVKKSLYAPTPTSGGGTGSVDAYTKEESDRKYVNYTEVGRLYEKSYEGLGDVLDAILIRNEGNIESMSNPFPSIERKIGETKESLLELKEQVESGSVGGGSGVTSAFITALQELFSAVAVWDSDKISNPSAKIEALSAYASGSDSPVIPDQPSGQGASLTWNGTTAKFSNLASVNVSWSGTTARIGA